MINPKQLTNNLKEIFENDPRVLAFVLVGSQARETIYTANQYSDMEAYIITKDEDADIFEQQLPEIVGKMGNVLFSFKHAIGFVAVYDDLFRLELPIIKESGMEGLFNRPKAQIVKILIDKTNGKLEEILEKRTDDIDYASEFKDKVINFWHWQIIAVQYFKKGEIYNTRAVLNIHASTLIKLFELLNDPQILLLETNKRIEQFLTKEQLANLQKIAPAYDIGQIKQALNEVMEIFPEIFQKIKAKYNYSFDEHLEEKVKPRLINLLR